MITCSIAAGISGYRADPERLADYRQASTHVAVLARCLPPAHRVDVPGVHQCSVGIEQHAVRGLRPVTRTSWLRWGDLLAVSRRAGVGDPGAQLREDVS